MTTLRDDFLWGASTAAHQIEGNNTTNDSWAMETTGGFPHIVEPSGDACDSFHRYPEDIRLLAEAGLTAYRFSIEWARIEPTEGAFSRAALLHYRDMINVCHANGVTPVITLHHFTNPLWFTMGGGWKRDDAIERFAAYVEFIADILHDVDWVVTINEPNIAAVVSALGDLLPFKPEERLEILTALGIVVPNGADDSASTGLGGDLPEPPSEMAEILGRAHRAAVEIIRRRTDAKVGWAVAARAFTPTPGNEDAFERIYQVWEGAFYAHSQGDDFIGIQAYTSQPVGPEGPESFPQDGEKTLTGWAYRPDALGIALKQCWERNGIPLLVTENGIATDDDQRRIDYTRDALQGLLGAVDEGADVLGYLHWSLLDNYEWGSYAPTFGLIDVNRTGDFERTPKPSLAWLGKVAATNISELTL